MQVVDDVLYKNEFADILIENKDVILEQKDNFHNLHLIANIFRNDKIINEKICAKYEHEAKKKLLYNFFDLCRTLDDITEETIPVLLDRLFKSQENEHIKIDSDKLPFYVNIFISMGNLNTWIENIKNYEINVLMKQNSKKTKKHAKYLSIYRNLNEKQKRIFYTLLVNLMEWD